MARVWTVMFSGLRASTSSRESRKPSTLSWGRPAIKSMLMQAKPTSRAVQNASRMSRAVWRRPMAWSTWSDMVWGLMEMRSIPCSRSTSSFSRVMVSGRPASTVISRQPARGRWASAAASRRSSWDAERVVGVPPPTYRVRTRSPACSSTCPVRRTSSSSAST